MQYAHRANDRGIRDRRPIEGFEGIYLISRSGRVWSLHSGKLEERSTFPGELGPRVALYRNGRAYQPYIHVLVRRTFGSDIAMVDELMACELMEEYGDNPTARQWLQETFEAA